MTKRRSGSSRSTEARGGRARRGVALVELLLCTSTILFFLLFSIAIWVMWKQEHALIIGANRQTFTQAATFQETQLAPPMAEGSGLRPPTIIPVPVIGAAQAMAGYRTLPNRVVHGVSSGTVNATAGAFWSIGYEFLAQGTVPRSPWTWEGYPYVNTQDVFESGRVQGWFASSRDQTLNEDTRTILGLSE